MPAPPSLSKLSWHFLNTRLLLVDYIFFLSVSYYFNVLVRLCQHLLPRTSISHQVNAGLLPSVGSFLSSETFASLWPRQDEPFNRFSRNNIGASTPLTAETNASHMISIPLQRDVGPTDNLV